FKHSIPRSLIVLSVVEVFILLMSVQIAVGIRFSQVETSEIGSLAGISALFSFVIFSCMVSMGLYQRHLRDGRKGMFIRISIAFIIAFVLISVAFYIFPSLFLGRGAFGIAYLIAFAGVIFSRLAYIAIVNREALNRRLLVLGAGEKAKLINELLRRRLDRRGFTIVGYMPLNNEKPLVGSDEIVEHTQTLIQLAEKLDVDEIVLAVSDRRKGFPLNELLDCRMSGVDVIDIQTFFERQAGRIILSLLQPSWLIFSDGFAQSVSRDVIKRSFDLLASTILLLATFPVMLLAALAIYIEDRGPVFYRQVRVGKNWRLIQVMKFRSMRVDAEKDGKPKFADADDDRITRVGKLIRKTRIDELPQLFNVLKGEMSFVGPRPERPEFVEKFTVSIPFYAERHRIKPGITGWAQICYPYGASEKDTIEKLQYDLYYVKNYSIFLDLTVLFQTAEVILWGKGAR
ncbi:MAG TPA: TIGR03013 family PEP-CTERM/XrtA system glycosyltransferase, partial [Gammaproteobacteria bacterium]|nr:TIGR03013 family PEP-CTERM/XrtA system glycosyltransferase [Gammaproteobacteria bacterium]